MLVYKESLDTTFHTRLQDTALEGTYVREEQKLWYERSYDRRRFGLLMPLSMVAELRAHHFEIGL